MQNRLRNKPRRSDDDVAYLPATLAPATPYWRHDDHLSSTPLHCHLPARYVIFRLVWTRLELIHQNSHRHSCSHSHFSFYYTCASSHTRDTVQCFCQLQQSDTRKLCYRKDDRAMRPTYGCPENFRDSLTTSMATILNTFMGFCSGRLYECSYKIWSPYFYPLPR